MRTILLLLATALLCPAQPRVIVVGVDGLGGEMLREHAPGPFQSLMRRGSWTLRARGVLPTVSSPNWASILMGAGPELHGVTSNDWQPDKFDIAPACTFAEGRFPTICGLLNKARPALHSAVIHDWDGFGRLVEPGAARAVRHVPGSPKAMDAAIEYWQAQQPSLLFVHLDDVDHAGHDKGWSTPSYRAAVEQAGDLINQLQAAAGPAAIILVVGDHGGTGTGHGHPTQRDLEVPWILAGPGIPANHEIRSAVSVTDTAPTLAAIFGIKPHPCWTGRAVVEVLPAPPGAR